MSLALFELFWLSTYPIYALLGIILLATGLSKGIYLSSLNILYRCVQQLHIHLCDFLGISRSTYMISDSMLIVLLKLIQQIFKLVVEKLVDCSGPPTETVIPWVGFGYFLRTQFSSEAGTG